jgi:hypothetical protein
MTRIAASCLLAVCCLGLSAFAADLEPGGVFFSGFLAEEGFYRMEVQTRQMAADQPQILAVKVYAEPSHTLLLALLDDSSPIELLQSISVQKPRAMATATIDESRLLVEATAPALDDQRIRIEYATDADGESGFQLLADCLFESLSQVQFSVEPLGGGSHHICGWCGPGGQMQFCGCVDCSTAEYTLCCNVSPCTIYCGHVMCSN